MAIFGTDIASAQGTATVTFTNRWIGCSGVAPAGGMSITALEIFLGGGNAGDLGVILVKGGTASSPNGGELLSHSVFSWNGSFGKATYTLPEPVVVAAGERLHVVISGFPVANGYTRSDQTSPAFSNSDFTNAYNIEPQPTAPLVSPSDPVDTSGGTLTSFAQPYQMALVYDQPTAGPTLSSVPATAFPGQSRTVTGTGFGATQGTGGLTIGGVTQTITSWSDTSITFTTVQGNNKYEAGKTLEVTTDAATTVSDTIEIVADTANGFGYVDMSSPNTTDESSVAFGTTPTVVTGDQFEWEDFNNLGNLTVDAQGFVSNVDTEGTFRGRFWDATDSTWGAVETFTASVPGEEDTWPFGKGINPAATKNWTWGRRHPKTNMRVRVYK